jgi:uncharacterized membrane protein YhdT
MSAFDGARDHDTDDAPGWWGDVVCCLALLLFIALWWAVICLVFVL